MLREGVTEKSIIANRQDKLIDFPHDTSKYSGTNSLVISGHGNADTQSSKLVLSRKDLKREKRVKKNDQNSKSLLSKKKRKKLQRIVDLKAKKQTRAELEKELSKYRSEKISNSTVSPIEIYSKNRHKLRLEKRQKKERPQEKCSESDDESAKSCLSDQGTENVEEHDQESSTTTSDLCKKRTASHETEMEAMPPKKKRKKIKRAQKKAALKAKEPQSSSHSSSEDEKDHQKDDISTTTKEASKESDDTNISSTPIQERHKKHFVTVQRSEELRKAREALPILSEEFSIMESLEDNDIIVLTGPTGCGKTTQVPQFLYEAGFTANKKMIGITEPRRVAAISMSNRVAKELNLSHKEVSYQIRYEGNSGDKTKIKFMTDGVLLQEMKSDFYLSAYSAIIVDEAHERSVYTDLLIGILSLIVRSRRSNENNPLKLIIMSATLDAVSFVNNRKLFPKKLPSTVDLIGRQHPISLHHTKRTPKDYLLASYTKACEIHRSNPVHGGILIFVTGAQEVQTLVRWLKHSFPGLKEKDTEADETKETDTSKLDECSSLVPIKMDNFATIPADEESEMSSSKRPQVRRPSAEDTNASDSEDDDDDDFMEMDGQDIPVYRDALGIHPLPLYSLLPSERQNMVFEPPPEGKRLIVVSTNVAETSLTIPNIRHVIDCGRVKEKVYDRVTGVSTFSINWISKASAKQRAGRAGRTGPGHCYRLYSSQVYEDFDEHPLPEILRRPVEDIVLLLKNFIGRINISSFPFPTSPEKEALISAEEQLIELDALEKIPDGKIAITLHGRYMANLPVAPRFAKILLLAYLQSDRSALPYAILLVSVLSIQELFYPRQAIETDAPTTEREKFENSFIKQGQSLLFGDFVLLLGPVWWLCWQLDKNKMPESKVKDLCDKYGIRWKALMEVRKLRRHLTEAANIVFTGLNLPIDSTSNSPPPEKVLLQLRQMLLTVYPGHVARKAVVPPNASASEKRGLKRAYFTTLVDGPVYIHPQSVMCNEGYDWILFLELHETTRKNMKTVMSINPEWLPLILPRHVHVTKPLADPNPKYDAEMDTILCQAERVEFGIRGWGLPSTVWAKYPTDKTTDRAEAARWFARLLMEGEVVTEMKTLSNKWIFNCKPGLITQPWGLVRPQVKNLLRCLGTILTKQELIKKWHDDPKFLWSVISQWLPTDERLNEEAKWPPIERK